MKWTRGSVTWEMAAAFLSLLLSCTALLKVAAWPFMVNEHLNRIDDRLGGIERVLGVRK